MLQLDKGRSLDLDDMEPIALTPKVVTLVITVLARCLTFLLPELQLLPLDPPQFRNSEDTHCVQAHPRRGRDSHAARRRIYAQVYILDVLEHHIHSDFSQGNVAHHQYSLCALMIRNRRSTSAISRKTPYKPALITCSRA